jgi:hypothetical protein
MKTRKRCKAAEKTILSILDGVEEMGSWGVGGGWGGLASNAKCPSPNELGQGIERKKTEGDFLC